MELEVKNPPPPAHTYVFTLTEDEARALYAVAKLNVTIPGQFFNAKSRKAVAELLDSFNFEFRSTTLKSLPQGE